MSYPVYFPFGICMLCLYCQIIHAVSVPVLEESDIRWQERLLVAEQAEAIIESRRLAREAKERRLRRTALSLPALEQRAVNIGERRIVFRRVEKLPEVEQVVVEPSSDSAALSPEILAAWAMSQQVIHEQISVAANVYGEDYSEITWRDTESRKEFTIWTNVNLNYLRPINCFSADGYHYDFIAFIYEYDEKSEQERRVAAAEIGYPAESRWKYPPMAISSDYFEYFVDSAAGTSVPEKLYRQMDALFAYYLEHRNEFEVRHKNAVLLQAAHEKSLKERPAVLFKEVIMNYTPLRGKDAE